MLYLHFSNRFEELTDTLARRLGTGGDPFAGDTVVIPHSAAKRQLQLELARANGICANVSFQYLAKWLWVQVGRVLPDVGPESPFDSSTLAWRMYAALEDPAFVAAHRPLADYLASAKADPVIAYELAASAASLMEQYITYRPDWLERWQSRPDTRVTKNEHEPWQAAAWSRIAQALSLRGMHPIEAMARELERAGDDAAQRFGLPDVVHVFGLPAIPPLYLTPLHSLGRFVDVHVYALNPCREFWFDVVNPRQLDRLEAQGQGGGREVGNALLASWGGQSQSALGLLAGIEESERTSWGDLFRASEGGTVLHRLQAGIVDLHAIEPGSLPRANGDRSIEIHVAHSLTRELEVLYNRLLGLFAADDTLRPSDVLVVTPDLEAAAPLIDGVFGTAPNDRKIPYAMTGRRRSSVNEPVKAFLQVLDLASSRCTASDVFDLLQQPVVRDRFRLDEEGLQQVHAWLIAAGFHWGLDASHVDAQGLPRHVSHTMADALSRLFLGYALPDAASEPFAGHLPRGNAEGSSSAALGALWRFAQKLHGLADDMARPHTAAQWARILHGAAENFIRPWRNAMADWLELQAAIDSLTQAIDQSGFEGTVPAPVMRVALENQLEETAFGGVPTGRVTFTGMSSLRNLPFRVVCAIGMNHGAFPTPDRPPEFDLMASAPRAGDRQRRTDQRTLFLDLLLAARDVLHLSYAGRSIRDNSPAPPSVLLSELLDVLVPATAADPASSDSLRAAKEALVIEHPLQPFSPEAFNPETDLRKRSFDAELAQSLRRGIPAASQLSTASGEEVDDADVDDDDSVSEGTRFFSAPLPEPGPEWRTVSAGKLVQFFCNPAKYLLNRRVRIDLARDAAALADDEPFVPDFECRSALAARLLPDLLRGADVDTARRLANAGTEMPPGAMGQGEIEAELASLIGFAQAVRRESAAQPLPPSNLSVDLELDGQAWRIEEPFADLRAHGLVRWRYDDERPTDVLNAWIPHLLLCAAAPAGVEPTTAWVARSEVVRYQPVPRDEARSRLRQLVALYREGLMQPLAFFPKSSRAFAESGKRKDAEDKWKGSEEFPGESSKPGYALAWRGVTNPLDAPFEQVAGEVFGGVNVTRKPFAVEATP